MKNYKSVWLIIAQTNLHVGDENLENTGVIDKTIQRDAITKIPCIHSSSLKGAVKEFVAYRNRKKKNEKKENEKKENEIISCKEVFGSDYQNGQDIQKGNSVFFDANLLVLPVQCTNKDCLFQLVYQSKVLTLFVERLKVFGLECSLDEVKNVITNEFTKLNEDVCSLKELSELEDDLELRGLDFITLCSDENLPIIARNRLETGESDGNLWYEQVLPTWSVLGTLICTDNNQLEDALNGEIIQIGGNATVGYGYCKFIKLA